MYFKYIYFMLSILQTHLHISVLNKNTLQLYFWYTKLVKLEQLILYVTHFNCAEVQLKIYWSIFDCTKVELLQVYFRYTLKENATVFPYSNMFFPQFRRVDMYLSRLSPCT